MTATVVKLKDKYNCCPSKRHKGLTYGTNPRKLGKTLAKDPPVDYSMQGTVVLEEIYLLVNRSVM